jgi:hypothetical protein
MSINMGSTTGRVLIYRFVCILPLLIWLQDTENILPDQLVCVKSYQDGICLWL